MCVSFYLPETIFGGKLCVCPAQLCSCKEKEWCRFYLRNLKLRFSIYVWTWSSFHRYHISVDVICFNVNHYIYLFCLLPIHILCTTLFAFLTSGYFHWLPSQIWSVQCPSSCSSSTLTTWVLIATGIYIWGCWTFLLRLTLPKLYALLHFIGSGWRWRHWLCPIQWHFLKFLSNILVTNFHECHTLLWWFSGGDEYA